MSPPAPSAGRTRISWRPYEDDDAEAISGLFERELGERLTPEVLRFKYGENPAGGPVLFELFAGERFCGQVGGIPQFLSLDGREVAAVQSVDVLLASEVRGGTTFLRALRAYEVESARRGLALIFGFPSGKFLTFLQRQGYVAVDAPVRMVLPLDGSVALRKAGLGGAAARLAGPVLGVALRGRTAWRTRGRTVAVEPLERFDRGILELWEDLRDGLGMATVRQPGHLNWRYVGNPQFRYRLSCAREGERITGYSVHRAQVEEGVRVGLLVDLFGRPGPVTDALLAAAIRSMQDDGVQQIRAWTAPGSPLRAALAQLGFVERPERRRLVVKALDPALDPDRLQDARRWGLVFGDCDGY